MRQPLQGILSKIWDELFPRIIAETVSTQYIADEANAYPSSKSPGQEPSDARVLLNPVPSCVITRSYSE